MELEEVVVEYGVIRGTQVRVEVVLQFFICFNYQTVVGMPGQPGAYTSFTATSETVVYFSYNINIMGM
jgi:hypothetical protein